MSGKRVTRVPNAGRLPPHAPAPAPHHKKKLPPTLRSPEAGACDPLRLSGSEPLRQRSVRSTETFPITPHFPNRGSRVRCVQPAGPSLKGNNSSPKNSEKKKKKKKWFALHRCRCRVAPILPTRRKITRKRYWSAARHTNVTSHQAQPPNKKA